MSGLQLAFFILLLVFLGYFLSINLIYTMLAIASHRGNIRRIKQATYTDFGDILTSFLTIPVSIVIAAYNEEKVIVNSVYSCINLEYPELEVIIVNDGSKDKTMELLKEEFQLYPVDYFYRVSIKTIGEVKTIYRSWVNDRLIVVDKENSGKADSLNAGINLARYRYVCTTDADSIFERDGMIRLMRVVLLDPGRIIAIGGQVRISNGLSVTKGVVKQYKLPRGITPNIQVVEYLRTFIANRLGWSDLNALLVISGAFGLWRKDVLEGFGGFSETTSCEDIEMTFGLHYRLRRKKADYSIISMPDPVTWTEVPSGFGDLFRQRERWHRAMLESFFRYRRMLLNPRFGTVGMLGMPYYFVYEIFGPFMEVAGYVIAILAASFGLIDLLLFGVFLTISIGYSAFISLLSLAIEQYDYDTFSNRDAFKLALLGLLEPTIYRQFTSIARIDGTFNAIRRKRAWRGPKRRGANSE